MSIATFETISLDDLVARLRDPARELALLDVREEGQFGMGHMLWAVNTPYSRLEAVVTALVPRRAADIVLVDEADGVAERAARRLAALGYGSLHVLAGGIATWRDAGHPLFHGVYVPGKVLGEWAEARYATPSIDAAALRGLHERGEPVVVLDPRTEDEHATRHVPGSRSCPNGELLYRYAALNLAPDVPVVIACGGRTRGIIGAQTLIDAGVPNPVSALRDGNHGWQLAGYALEHGLHDPAPVPGAAATVRQRLIEEGADHARRHDVPRIDRSRLREWQHDPDRTLYLLDVRSPREYALGHLPEARNAPGGQLVQACDRWIATLRARVVLVDDDGVRAVQAALWLRRLGWNVYALTTDAIADAAADAAAGVAVDAAPVESEAGSARADTQGQVPLSADAAARVDTELGDVARHAEEISPATADAWLREGALAVCVDRSEAYQQAHPPHAAWANRSRLETIVELARTGRSLVLFSEDGRLAHLAAIDLREASLEAQLYVARGGQAAWTLAGLPLVESAQALPREDRIDFLFWAHDRRQGNAEAMRAYLQWEKQLLVQAAQEPAGFPLVGGPYHQELE